MTGDDESGAGVAAHGEKRGHNSKGGGFALDSALDDTSVGIYVTKMQICILYICICNSALDDTSVGLPRCVCLSACMSVYHINKCGCVYVCMYVCVYVCVCVCVSIDIDTCIYMWIYLHTYIHRYTYIIHTHTHTHTHTHQAGSAHAPPSRHGTVAQDHQGA